MRYSVQPRDYELKGYEFLSFAKNMGKNIGKNISWSLSGKYSQKRFDHANQSATYASKTSSKTAIEIKLQKFQKIYNNINSETVSNEYAKEIPKKKYISKRNSRNYWWTNTEIKNHRMICVSKRKTESCW